MKLKIFSATALIAAATVLIVFSQMKSKPFAAAEDFPGKALVYIQIADLPALIKLWNESKFKEKYLASDNYKDFANNHLGRKLASRWREFSDAAGFSIDLEALSGIAGNRASLAVYDVGKLEFVFIAPVSDEIFAATGFARNRGKFTEETFADGTVIYRAAVEADRGRQKQELIFTQANGRFILATSEKLVAQTLDNITGGGKSKNRLIDEPLFKTLSEKIQPRAATVWVDQTALNDDYYFKHYWLMSDVSDLKNMRAGIFDFEIGAAKLVERRSFLLDKAADISPVESADAEKLSAYLPPDAPFYRLQAGGRKAVGEAVEKTFFAVPQETENMRRRSYSNYSPLDDGDYSGGGYDSLSGKFDESIDETDDDGAVERSEIEIDFPKILQTANPRAVLTFIQPQTLAAPMFVKFRRAAVVSLASPKSFDRENFESAIARKLSAQTLIAAPNARLDWETKSENAFVSRELKLPMLGWSVNYALTGGELIVANDAEFLRQILNAPNLSPIKRQNLSPFTSLSVINFGEKQDAFVNVFGALRERKQADDFFTENIASLLDAAAQIKRIEIKEDYSRGAPNEEITFDF